MANEQNQDLRNYVILYIDVNSKVLSFSGIGRFGDYERERNRINRSGNTVLFSRPGLTDQQYSSIHDDVLSIHSMIYVPEVQTKLNSLVSKINGD
ncbi:hypothetical protein HYT23_01425 [Candidatus Pacearchaeota archaeon]|nr:hypothetical protein [Candidatus Pacearchaeota archaeon]